MKIPKSIKSGGFIWTVHEDKDVAHEGNIFGSTHYGSQKIFLEPGMPQQHREQVLLHELMHTVFWQSGLGKRYAKTNPEMEEEVITALSQGMYQIIIDNKLFK